MQRNDDPKPPKNEFYIQTVTLNGKLCSNQTGWFPVTSSTGNKYVMVVYNHESNEIITDTLKKKAVDEQLNNIAKFHTFLREHGIPKINVMDNECPEVFKAYLRNNKSELQLFPKKLHRTNTSEKAIGIFKDHFISGFC